MEAQRIIMEKTGSDQAAKENRDPTLPLFHVSSLLIYPPLLLLPPIFLSFLSLLSSLSLLHYGREQPDFETSNHSLSHKLIIG